jgi:rhamnose transport system permease protein
MTVSDTPVQQPTQQAEPTMTVRLRDMFLSQEVILLLILVLGVLILSTQNERFLQVDNMLNQGRLLAEVALVALPMTLIIITGGLFIVRVGVPPLIMTLATLSLYRGMALGISQARQARGFPEWFYQLGQKDFAGMPTQLWLVIIATIIVGILLARTAFGRSIYAIGNNEVGSRFSGIPVDRYKLYIYTFSGFMAGLAGYIFVSRVSTTRSDMGTGLELDAISAVVLGGTSIFGGSGNIAGTLIGLVLIQLLKNGLALSGVKGDATIVVVGTVLILAILVNSFIQRRRGVA